MAYKMTEEQKEKWLEKNPDWRARIKADIKFKAENPVWDGSPIKSKSEINEAHNLVKELLE